MDEQRRPTRKIPLNCSLVLVSATISLFLFEYALDIAGYPTEVPQRIAHPANYEEVRQNLEFHYVFKTNSRGLRYRDIPQEESPGTYRVFVSGDSFTEGLGVEDGQRFTDLLERQFHSSYSNALFINGGLTGTGPLQYGKLFLDVGLSYRPDALLICVFVNDVANTPENLPTRPFGDPAPRTGFKQAVHVLWPRIYTQLKLLRSHREVELKTSTTDFIQTVSEQARIKKISETQIDAWRNSLPQDLVDAINQGTFTGPILSYGLLYPEYWVDSIDISNARAERKWNSMAIVLTEIIERARRNEVETSVVLIPSYFQYDARSHVESSPWIVSGTVIRDEWLSGETEIQRRMRLWASSESVSYLDLTPVFREAVKSHPHLNWVLDGHWTGSGHQVAADAIASWLDRDPVFSFASTRAVTNQ